MRESAVTDTFIAVRRWDASLLGLARWFVPLALGTCLIACGEAQEASRPDPISFVSPGVAYHPRGFSPNAQVASHSRNEIANDLRKLREVGFRSIVTYAADGAMGAIPELARKAGFDGAVVMGIWDPSSREEWANAIAQAVHVDGYCVGNEGLGKRYQRADLANRMAELRRITGLPVTTSEPIDSYLAGEHRQWLLANSDWLFPLAHPFWASRIDPKESVNWIISRQDYLAGTTIRQLVLKEAGVPSGGVPGYDEDVQVAFFAALEAAHSDVFYFEAFDQPWKRTVLRHHDAEAHWGLFRSDGSGKKIVSWLGTRMKIP